MTTLTFSNKTTAKKFGKIPVVVLPLEDYERMKENLEMMASKKLPRIITKARSDKKTYSAAQVKEILDLR